METLDKAIFAEVAIGAFGKTNAQPAHTSGMFTGFGVRPQQAEIVFVPTKTLLAKDLRPAKV
jgi:hypothetical protein